MEENVFQVFWHIIEHCYYNYKASLLQILNDSMLCEPKL